MQAARARQRRSRRAALARRLPRVGSAVAWTFAACLAGCGAKTALHHDEPSARSPDAGVDAGSRDAGSADAGADAGERCFDATVELEVDSAPPTTVVLVLDGSSSMLSDFGAGLTRWEAVRAAITGPDGIVRELADRVPFAVVRYSGAIECPGIDSRPARLNATRAIDEVLAAFEGGTTPTAEALAAVRADLERLNAGFPGEVAMVLATDGEPVPCDGSPTDDAVRRRVVEQVEAAFAGGVRTFVLSVGSELSEAHLSDLANAGAGVRPGDPDVPTWRADDPAALSELVATAVGAAVACTTRLPWSIGEPCDAEVTLGGEVLTCGDPDGFRIEGVRLSFSGRACEAWEAGAPAQVRRPCR